MVGEILGNWEMAFKKMGIGYFGQLDIYGLQTNGLGSRGQKNKNKIKPEHVNKMHTRPKIKISRVMHDTIINAKQI